MGHEQKSAKTFDSYLRQHRFKVFEKVDIKFNDLPGEPEKNSHF